MKAAVDQEVPVGTLGTIVREDMEDTDLHTYEVQWDNGVHSNGVREYNMEILPDAELKHASSYLARYEARQIRKSIPAIFASVLRLRAYVRQATDQRQPAEIIAEFKSKIVPMLDNYMYQKLDTGEQIIIPESSEGWNAIHRQLDTYHDLLRPFMDQPDVAAVVREIEEYHTQVQSENTPKDDLAKLKDSPQQDLPWKTENKFDGAGIQHPEGWRPDDVVEPSAPAGKVEDVMSALPSEETGMDELLDRWNQAQSADQKAQIERRIKDLHEKMLHAYLRSQK